MIRMTKVGTTYLTTEAFLARHFHAAPGETFVYATGDLAHACQHEADAVDLRKLTQAMRDRKEIELTQRPRRDLEMKYTGGRAFEYLATKRSNGHAT